jgi:L-threonylcarbamoyladenylate synthase
VQDINDGATQVSPEVTPGQQSAPATRAKVTLAPVVQDGLGDAVAILQRGGLVAVPTETVYGLGADARNPAALARLYKVKGRPETHPVIVHIADAEGTDEWARDIPDYARALAARFWPGPLTLVLKRAQGEGGVLDAVTGGQDTVGLRVPSHPVALQLLQELSHQNGEVGPHYFGLAAPSANRFGRLSPTQADHVQADLGGDVDLIIDGGPCEVGIESTIVDCTGDAPVILRPGRIPAGDIQAIAGVALAQPGEDAARAPGTLAAHYAPRAKLRLLKRSGIIEAVTANKGHRIAVLALEVPVVRVSAALSVVVPAVAAGYARTLYANLRTLDAAGADLILVEMPPETPAWAGILDRLRRAAAAEEQPKAKRPRFNKARFAANKEAVEPDVTTVDVAEGISIEVAENVTIVSEAEAVAVAEGSTDVPQGATGNVVPGAASSLS